jgi:hypothetical protein
MVVNETRNHVIRTQLKILTNNYYFNLKDGSFSKAYRKYTKIL